jgi:hypothetical protein
MSLKAFHIVFVTASVLLLLVLAGWCFGNYREDGATIHLVWGSLSVAASSGMVAYGKLFLRKFKNISYL